MTAAMRIFGSFRRMANRASVEKAARGALTGRCQPPDRGSWYGRALATGLEFRVLGPLEVRDGGRRLHLGGVRQRSVLAILLLDAGAVVSSDRLIEELWPGDRPDDAQTALQQHVSRLRKLLAPHEVLLTRAPGYVLEVVPGALDLHRFEALRAEGRAALAELRASDAARALREALAEWRGPLLADLQNEELVREPARRLEEARLETVESLNDAELELGRHRQLVGELRAQIADHPFRERLRAQLMLALYRSGRQAEALDVYADARRTLVDELGLEPGPELQQLQQAILAHDPELEARRTPEGARRSRAGLPVVLAGAAAVAAAAAAVAFVGGGDDGDGARAPIDAGHAVALDAGSGDVRRRLAAGRTPTAIAARDGVVWLVDADARTVLRVDPSSRVVETLSTGQTPIDVAVADGSVWVANGQSSPGAQFVGPVPTSIARLDGETRTSRGETDLPQARGAVANHAGSLATSGRALWAVTADFAVVRIDAASGAITATSRAVRAASVAAGPAGVWAVGVDGEVVRLDEETARPLVRTRVPTSSVGSIAVGDGAAWITSPVDGTLYRVGGTRTSSLGSIALSSGITDVAAGEDAVWVVNPVLGTVAQVDPADGTVIRTLEVDGIPRAVTVDGDAVWVAVAPGPEMGVGGEAAGVGVLPRNVCEPVVAGAGREADLLVVSDLPLQGGSRALTAQVAQAIAFVLREHRFRAGRFRLAYQSCDDSIASTGLFDEAKCRSNARAYAENPHVIGVIGTFNSACAVVALPELNRAPGGPLAMVSPTNSFGGLTRPGVGVDPSLPAALYPSGRRNYVRVLPTDDMQGAALALLARDRGRERVFVLDDGDPGYGALMATGFETAARRLGLEVAGRETWDPAAKSYEALVARVARSGAGGVFVGGLLDTNAAKVVRELRARLGSSVDLLAPDGLTPLPLFVEQAGPAALGTYVAAAGIVTDHLPPAGTRFVARFGQTQPGVAVQPYAVYAAQATEVLLAAIARSDGTRPSVVDELFRLRVEDGLLGSFSFDRNGDITESPVTIFRVRRGGTSTAIQSVEGGTVVRVMRPSAKLVMP
jgi:DNA-binding SARP family transcriptional activator/ABC-type branched-subunit amino acid transport system substrate-binding protein